MKKILLYTFTVAGLLMGMVSCDKIADTDDVPHTQSARIAVADTLVRVPATAGTSKTIVIVTGENKNWNPSTTESWLSVSKGSTDENGKLEETIEITYEANTYYSRYGVVTLTLEGEGLTRNFRVLQESALGDPYVNIGDNVQLNIRSIALDTTLAIETNQSVYNVSTNAEWISFTKNANTLEVHFAENTALISRTDSFTVVAGTAPHTATRVIKVRQSKPDTDDEITIAGIEFVRVKAGSFWMGAQKTDPTGINYLSNAQDIQSPVHRVTISRDFYIGKYELTQAQYEAVTGNNPSLTKGANHPVENLTWTMANSYTIALSQQEGLTFRLPTEAEWEYAARGGSESPHYIYSGSNNPNDVAYHFTTGGTERADAVTKPVGTKLPNFLGIYDMSGNVYEWCYDKQVPYPSTERVDPIGVVDPTVIDKFILRGGSWYHNATSQTVSYRGSNKDDFPRGYLGFRIVYIPEEN